MKFSNLTMTPTPTSSFKPDMSIYRYMKFEHFLDFVKTGKYGISMVTQWDDPYENCFAKCPFLDRYGKHIIRSAAPYYGQCWTVLEESDAMWRIYSRINTDTEPRDLSGMAVRIKTSVEKLCQIADDVWATIHHAYVGHVAYKEQEEIDRGFRELTSLRSTAEYWEKEAQSFFVKRKAFGHEKEFRIIFASYKGGTEHLGSYMFKPLIEATISANSVIDEVSLDPRLTETEYELHRQKIIDAGFSSEKINKSELHDFEPFVIQADV